MGMPPDSSRPGRAGGKIPPAAATVSASPMTFTAPEDCTMFVFGGTVSSITIDGVQVLNDTGHAIPLEAGDVAVITYSVAPTVRFRPRS